MGNKFSIKTAISLIVVLILGLGGIYIAFQVTQTQKKQETRSKATDTATAVLTFNKTSDVTAEINLDPGGHKVTAVQIVLKFDPTKVKINSLTPSSQFPNVLQNTLIDNTNGTASAMLSPIKVADLSALQAGQTAENLTLKLPAKVADMGFQLLQQNNTSIQFDTTQTIVTSYGESNNVLNLNNLTPLQLSTTLTPTPTTILTVTPTPTNAVTNQLTGDFNHDGKVDIFDFSIFVENFGNTTCGNIADLTGPDSNGHCKVDIFDFSIFVENFGRSI